MNEKRRQKGRNFSNQEISLLLSLIEKFLVIIENKKTDANTVKQKNEAWMELATIFNANNNNNNEERTVVQLKTFYDNFKRKKRRESAENNNARQQQQQQTTDISFTKKIDLHGERLFKMLEQFQSNKNIEDTFEEQDSNSSGLVIHENDDGIKQENDESINYNRINEPVTIIHEEEEYDEEEESHSSINQEQLNNTAARPSCSNHSNIDDLVKLSHLKKRKPESASSVYKELVKFTAAKTAKKNYETEYFQLKLAYKKRVFERKLEMDKELFLLEKRRIENDLKLQEIKIEQEKVVLQKMKRST